MDSSIILFPQPDPLLRSSQYRHLLLMELTDSSDAPMVELPIANQSKTSLAAWTVPYFIHKAGLLSDILVWELHPRYDYVRDWLGYFPLPVKAALIPLSDPKFTAYAEESLVEQLLVEQWKLCEAIINEVKENLNIPVILVYIRRWTDSPNLEKVILRKLESNVHVYTYQADDLSELSTKLKDTLANNSNLESLSRLPEKFAEEMIVPIEHVGVGQRASTNYVKQLAAHLSSASKTCTIWLDGSALSAIESFEEDNAKNPNNYVRYKDMTIAVPQVNKSKTSVTAAYYPYIEYNGAAFSSFESWYGDIAISDYQANMKSVWRISKSIDPDMNMNEIEKILDEMIQNHQQ